MNRLDQKLRELKQEKRSGLVCYFTAGDPGFVESSNLFSQLGQAGADIIEIGIPFSDPVADGEIIQAAHIRALSAGQTVNKTIELVKEIRLKDNKTPIVFMTYLNPILQYGFEKLVCETENLIEGILILDAPLEYQDHFKLILNAKNMHLISMTAPTTPVERLEQISASATGFLYHVAENGLTGGNLNLPNLEKKIAEIKPIFNIPIAIGFGIKNESHVKALANKADLIVVGSALVETFFKQGVDATLEKVRAFSQVLKQTK
ncbi:tryptophan synthase subunit alpha [Acinetobacter terrestris]|jgi:tryptophan synthase alpha chain|uniref:Tryptophan synthase alpha chain n=1 Tax=Acinetobacter terrestris TaxID=2529843 RepID=A0AAW6UXF0_9GAMM|nr:tryptophan synthase subunit alpha [Acinetobacter terrestris]MDK1685152.1 tryptophan synthase subunit alpha [Acinetobacter terrestris]